MKKFLVAIDQGTTSSRAILFDTSGNIKFTYQQEFKQYFPKNGWVEHNPNEIWKTTLKSLKKVIQKSNKLNGKILSIGITNQRETTVLWNKKNGEPVYNAIVWQDRRTSAYCSEIATKNNQSLVKEKTGLLIDSYFSATKIKWILDNVDGVRARAEAGELCFGTVDTYLMYRLSEGEIFKTDITNASRTMLFNINTLNWDEDLLNLFNIPRSLLPEVVHSDANFGTLKNLENISIHAVLGDQQAALFGQGCLSKGQLKSTYGTGCFVMANVGNTPIHSNDGLLTTIGFSLNGEICYAIEGSIYASGTTVQWLRDNLQFFETSDQSEPYLHTNGDANNVLFVPAFTGLGAPYWNSDVRASFHGITRDTSRSDLINAAFNSITYQTKDIIDCLVRSGIEVESLNVDGGMVANKTFVQQIANLLNTEVSVPENSESTARGVAVLAGVASKTFDLELISSQKRMSIYPNEEAHSFMAKDYKIWKELIIKLLSP